MTKPAGSPPGCVVVCFVAGSVTVSSDATGLGLPDREPPPPVPTSNGTQGRNGDAATNRSAHGHRAPHGRRRNLGADLCPPNPRALLPARVAGDPRGGAARRGSQGGPRLLRRVGARSDELPRAGALVRLDRRWRKWRRDVTERAPGPGPPR